MKRRREAAWLCQCIEPDDHRHCATNHPAWQGCWVTLVVDGVAYAAYSALVWENVTIAAIAAEVRE